MLDRPRPLVAIVSFGGAHQGFPASQRRNRDSLCSAMRGAECGPPLSCQSIKLNLQYLPHALVSYYLGGSVREDKLLASQHRSVDPWKLLAPTCVLSVVVWSIHHFFLF